MSDPKTEFSIRRVLVALGASRQNLSALEAAANIAASLEAELFGLFIEDINLFRLTELPFARQIGYLAPVGEEIDREKIERELRVKAEQMRRMLASTAERARVPWSFRVARGKVTSEVLAVATKTDLLAVERMNDPFALQARLDFTLLAGGAESPNLLLLTGQSLSIDRPIAVIYDDAPEAGKSLAAATHLAGLSHADLVVMIPAKDPGDFRTLQDRARQAFGAAGDRIRYCQLERMDISSLLEAIKQNRAGILVLGYRNPLLQQAAWQKLPQVIKRPILLVR